MHNKVTATRLEQLRVEYGFVYVTWKAHGQRLMFRLCIGVSPIPFIYDLVWVTLEKLTITTVMIKILLLVA